MSRVANAVGVTGAVLWVMLVVYSLEEGVATAAILVFLAATLVVGWVLAARMPRHPMGWLLLAIAGFFLLGLPLQLAGEALLDTHPTAAAWLLWYGGDRDDAWIWLPPIGLLFTQVLLLFPDGRLPSRGWRYFQWFAIAALVYGTAMFAMIDTEVAPGLANPIGFVSAENTLLVASVFLPLLLSFAGSAWSLVWRYRRAPEVQREQIKWVVLAGGLVVGAYIVTLPISFAVPEAAEDARIFTAISFLYSLIPVSIGVAVLKYRLYEIDRIVSRTVSWGVVTLAVLATYAVVVTSVSRLVPGSNTLAVAGATLAAAAVFRPVLHWVQDRVDRRFNRARFDADLEVEAFAARLRNSVDPDAAAGDLVATVERTLGPSVVGMWVPGSRP